MQTEKTIKAQISPILDYIEWGAIGDELWQDGYTIFERIDADNFSSEERGRLCEILRDIAGRILLVAEDIKQQ